MGSNICIYFKLFRKLGKKSIKAQKNLNKKNLTNKKE